jgi:hypothetical protein
MLPAAHGGVMADCHGMAAGSACLAQLPHFDDFAAPKAAEFLGFSGAKQSVVLKETPESRINV